MEVGFEWLADPSSSVEIEGAPTDAERAGESTEADADLVAEGKEETSFSKANKAMPKGFLSSKMNSSAVSYSQR